MRTKCVKNILLAGMIACASVFLSCTDNGGFFGDNRKFKAQKYYSADSPGMWEAQAESHDVEAAIISDAKGKKGIEIFVPFTAERSEEHYVEVIVLMDDRENQLAVAKFKRGEKAKTIFEITGNIRFPVYVVAKCNMHGMWRKKVEGNEKAGE